MKIWDIIFKAGKVALSVVAPGAVTLINEFLPEDKKLPENATGEQAKTAIESLPPEQAAQIFSKELDVEITEIQEYTKVISALAEVDKTGSSTRPFIARLMAWQVFLSGMFFSSSLSYAIITQDSEMIGQLQTTWPLALAILATPTALLRAYFAMRTKEKKARYDMTAHVEPQGNTLSQIIGMFKE